MTASEVKSITTVAQVLARYGLHPNKSGFVSCPFHGERTASLKVWDDHFHCYGCERHGDIFDLVQHFENCDFTTALKLLGGESESDPERIRQARERQHRQELIDDIQLGLRKLLADALTAAWTMARDYKPTDPNADFHPGWRLAMNTLPWLEYVWDETQISGIFPRREADLFEIKYICAGIILAQHEHGRSDGSKRSA